MSTADPLYGELLVRAHLDDIGEIARYAAKLQRDRKSREALLANAPKPMAIPVPEELLGNELKTFEDVKLQSEHVGIVETWKERKGAYVDLGIHETIGLSNGGERRINGYIPLSSIPQGVELKEGSRVFVRIIRKDPDKKIIMLQLIRRSE